MGANGVHYDRWFQTADSDRDGRVTGGDAVTFFGRSGLPREVRGGGLTLNQSRKETGEGEVCAGAQRVSPIIVSCLLYTSRRG